MGHCGWIRYKSAWMLQVEVLVQFEVFNLECYNVQEILRTSMYARPRGVKKIYSWLAFMCNI